MNDKVIPQDLIDDLKTSQEKVNELVNAFKSVSKLSSTLDKSNDSILNTSDTLNESSKLMQKNLEELEKVLNYLNKIFEEYNKLDSKKILSELSNIKEKIDLKKIQSNQESFLKKFEENINIQKLEKRLTLIEKNQKKTEEKFDNQIKIINNSLKVIIEQTKKKGGIFS